MCECVCARRTMFLFNKAKTNDLLNVCTKSSATLLSTNIGMMYSWNVLHFELCKPTSSWCNAELLRKDPYNRPSVKLYVCIFICSFFMPIYIYKYVCTYFLHYMCCWKSTGCIELHKLQRKRKYTKDANLAHRKAMHVYSICNHAIHIFLSKHVC